MYRWPTTAKWQDLFTRPFCRAALLVCGRFSPRPFWSYTIDDSVLRCSTKRKWVVRHISSLGSNGMIVSPIVWFVAAKFSCCCIQQTSYFINYLVVKFSDIFHMQILWCLAIGHCYFSYLSVNWKCSVVIYDMFVLFALSVSLHPCCMLIFYVCVLVGLIVWFKWMK